MDTFEVKETKEALVKAVSEMADREKTVLTLYYYEGLTLAEIGDILGVTESRVCQIHTKAVLQLRAKLADRPEGAGRQLRGAKAAASPGRHLTDARAAGAAPAAPARIRRPARVEARGPRALAWAGPTVRWGIRAVPIRTRPRPRSPRTGVLQSGINRHKEQSHGRHHHEATVGRGRPLRAPDPSVEPQDAPVHHRRAQRDLPDRPRADDEGHRGVLRLHPGPRRRWRAPSSSSGPRSRPRARSPSTPTPAACPT